MKNLSSAMEALAYPDVEGWSRELRERTSQRKRRVEPADV